MLKADLRGIRETQQALRRLRDDIAVPLNEAGREALKPVLAAAKANVPKRHRRLMRSLQIRRNPKSPRLRPRFRVGPFSTDKALFKYLSRLSVILEFGRKANRSGKGAISPRAWLRQAFDSSKDAMIKKFGDSIGPAFEKRAAKVAARIKRK